MDRMDQAIGSLWGWSRFVDGQYARFWHILPSNLRRDGRSTPKGDIYAKGVAG